MPSIPGGLGLPTTIRLSLRLHFRLTRLQPLESSRACSPVHQNDTLHSKGCNGDPMFNKHHIVGYAGVIDNREMGNEDVDFTECAAHMPWWGISLVQLLLYSLAWSHSWTPVWQQSRRHRVN